MKKIVDEKGRLFGKLSLIDVIAIVVVILLIVGIFMRFFVLESTSVTSETTPVTYQVEATSVRMYAVDAIKPGDAVYDKDTGAPLGKVTAVEYSPAELVENIYEKDYFNGVAEDYYDMTVTIQAQGTVTGGRTYLNKTYELNVNSKRQLLTKYCSFTAKISEIG